MKRKLKHGFVRDHPLRVIHVVRETDALLETGDLDGIAAAMRRHVLDRHVEQEVVVVLGDGKETCGCSASPMRWRACAPPCSMRR